jgi:hypothetical protein
MLQPSAHAAAQVPADGDDETPMSLSYTVLLWLHVVVMLRFLSRARVFLAFPPPPSLLLFALNLHCRLAAAVDALSCMVNSELLLLDIWFQTPVGCKGNRQWPWRGPG